MAKPKTIPQTNPSLVKWPTDKWGLTKDLKHALIMLSSRLSGHPDKKKLFDETLAVGLEFLEHKYAQDNAVRNERIKEAQRQYELALEEEKTAELADEADKRN